MNEAEEQVILEMCDDDVARSRTALEQFLVQHAGGLLQAIRSLLAARGMTYNVDDMAEEILGDVTVELLESARSGSLLEVKSLPEYIYGAARNATFLYLRRGASRREQAFDAEPFWEKTDRLLVRHGVNPSEVKEFEDVLYACIERLPEVQKRYILMRASDYDSPPSPTEIANVLGVSPESVRNRLHEARKELKECMKKKGYPIPSGRLGAEK